MTALAELKIENVDGLNSRAVLKLKDLGHEHLGDISAVDFYELYDIIGFDQAKKLLSAFMKAGGKAKFSRSDWSEEDWANFVQGIVTDEIVTWNEVAMAVCGGLKGRACQVVTTCNVEKKAGSQSAARLLFQ